MMKLIIQIKQDLLQAMKSKDTAKLTTLRLLLAELEKEKIVHKLNDVKELSNEQVEAVISRQIKKLDKEIESYVAVGRTVESQETEKELLQAYLPKQLTEDEILTVVSDIAKETKESGQNIGYAMKKLSALLKGRADMAKVSKLVKSQF